MGIECKIYLDKRNEEDFKPGDVIGGKVNYSLKNDIVVNEILLSLKGKARCHWTEHKGNTTVSHVGKEKLFKHSIGLLDQKSPDDKIVIEAGSHTRDFRFLLPESTPYSFEKSTATHITYCLKLIFARPELYKKNPVFRKLIKVAPFVDLSTPGYSAVREPTSYVVTKDQTMLFSKIGEMTTRVYLPRTAFTPGECIPLTLDVQNGCTLTLPCIKSRIIKIRTYYNSNKSRKHIKEYEVFKSPPTEAIQVGERKNLTCQLSIPPETLPSLLHCQVLAVNYVIRLRVCYPGMRFDAKLEVPIVIGSVVQPVAPALHRSAAGTSYGTSYPHANSCDATTPPPPAYLPPPSYWEVMQLEKRPED